MLPLLCYLYLPIRAMARPDMSWGYPRTPFDLYYHITGRNYAQYMFHMPFREVWGEFVFWFLGLGRELHWGFVAFALVGIVAACVSCKQRPLACLLTWIVAADVVYTCNYGIYNQYIYFIPSYVALGALAAMGLNSGWEFSEARHRRGKAAQICRPRGGLHSRAAGVSGRAALPPRRS